MRFYYPLFAGLMIMFGAMLLCTQLISIREALSSKNWTATEAQVTTFKNALNLAAKYDATGDGLKRIMLPGMFAEPRICFTYPIGDRLGASVNYSYSIDPLGPKQAALDKIYPIGSVVTAYFDPSTPENAVMKPGLNDHFYLICLSALAAVCLGVYWITRSNEDNVV